MRRLLPLLCVTAAVTLASFATPGAVRAEDDVYAHCTAFAFDLGEDQWGGLHSRGQISCTAGGSPWVTPFTIEVCLQKWVRPDDQFYDVGCNSDGGTDSFRQVPYTTSCGNWGYGEYRVWVHAAWFAYDSWHNDWAFSNVSWACFGW